MKPQDLERLAELKNVRYVKESTGETARRTSQVMDRVLAGYYGGREDEFWLRPATWPGRRCHQSGVQ